MDSTVLERIRQNDHRVLSRVISQIENNGDIPENFFVELYPYTNKALRIGVTGPPGAGKSTLVDKLIGEFLKHEQSVGVVAVDPTSPFTGGALLGDRVRMNRYSWNDNVFIRSMGSHGDLGGLARKAQDVGDVLAASGKQVVIFETVGVGQGEHDIMKAVDVTVVVLTPESGDDIQLMKAGLIEIADIFVINKSDREGAGRLSQVLRNLLHTFNKEDKPEPPVMNTVATTGEGIPEFYGGLMEHLDRMRESGMLEKKYLQRHRNRILTLIQDKLLTEFWTSNRLKQLEEATRNVDSVKASPHEIAWALVKTTPHD